MFFYQFDDGKWNDGAFCYGDTTDDTRTFLCEWDKLLGDANKDGKIDTEDALMVLRAALGITNNANTLRSNCDMDFSGKLDTTDALMILRMALGIN